MATNAAPDAKLLLSSNKKIIESALRVEECFWRTFLFQKGRPTVLRICTEDLRKALQDAGHKPAFSDDWIEKLKTLE